MGPQSIAGRMQTAAETSQGEGLRLVGFPAAPPAVARWLQRKSKSRISQPAANWMSLSMGHVASLWFLEHAVSLLVFLAC